MSASDLSKVLKYAQDRNFKPIVEKAKETCKNSRQNITNHFVEYHEMVSIGSGLKKGMMIK